MAGIKECSETPLWTAAESVILKFITTNQHGWTFLFQEEQ